MGAPMVHDEEEGPNPERVDILIGTIGEAIKDGSISGVTTHADVLSAIFTVLHRFLQYSQSKEAPEDHERNAKEVGRVLGDFLMEFGAVDLQ